ncbi:hypothetical protein ACWEPC_47145 [Nonomuraea sp. NPDC004297]
MLSSIPGVVPDRLRLGAKLYPCGEVRRNAEDRRRKGIRSCPSRARSDGKQGEQRGAAGHMVSAMDNSYLLSLVEAFVGLARRAKKEDQLLYCWICV